MKFCNIILLILWVEINCPMKQITISTLNFNEPFGAGIIFLILAHSLYKMWIIQEPNKLELWNKLNFKEKKNGVYTPCLKYSVPIFVELIYKMQFWRLAVR